MKIEVLVQKLHVFLKEKKVTYGGKKHAKINTIEGTV
jgi:hypothetical protein